MSVSLPIARPKLGKRLRCKKILIFPEIIREGRMSSNAIWKAFLNETSPKVLPTSASGRKWTPGTGPPQGGVAMWYTDQNRN